MDGLLKKALARPHELYLTAGNSAQASHRDLRQIGDSAELPFS